MTTEGQGKRPAAQARLLMKRPLQLGQDARIFPGTKVMVSGARARELAGGSRRHWQLRGPARSASGHSAEGITCIEDGIRDWRASGSRLLLPYWLALKAEALHLADRSSEALESVREAEELGERSEERWCSAQIFHKVTPENTF